MQKQTPIARWLSPVGAVLTALVGLAACSSTTYVAIRHPLHVGQVDQNSIPVEARHAESAHGVAAGTLVDEANLTEVTPERICVNLTLWSIDDDVGRGQFQSYRMALLTEQDGVEVATPQIQVGQPTVMPVQGYVPRRIQTGSQRVCGYRRNGICVSWRTEPVYTTIQEPRLWQVVRNPASVCFPNGGFVTPATQRVRLELARVGSAWRNNFEWQFTSQVQQ